MQESAALEPHTCPPRARSLSLSLSRCCFLKVTRSTCTQLDFEQGHLAHKELPTPYHARVLEGVNSFETATGGGFDF